MIEVVTFGGGLRLDGPNWGRRALPYLERNWRELSPGIHMLDPAGDFAITNKLLVSSDGRGRFSFDIHPEIQATTAALSGLAQMVAMSISAQIGDPIDEKNRFRYIANMPWQDLVNNQGPNTMTPSTLLIGLVRYNPS